MKATAKRTYDVPRLDRWIQRATWTALVALALGLLGFGFALYT